MIKHKPMGKLKLTKSTLAALTVRTGVTAGGLTGSSMCLRCMNHNLAGR